MSDGTEPRVPVIYNLDDTEYFVGTFGPIVPETIDKFVDDHAALGITDLFVCVNDQRTNYRSDVWEAQWDGYDPNLGDDQPFLSGVDPQEQLPGRIPKNTYSLYKQGCDYPQRMIDRCRNDQVRPWISVRMNDCHYPEWPDHPYHSSFWKAHPEWWLPYGMDYEQPAVREHYMKLVREVCSRYDVEGIELDYQRFWLYFRPGREHEGAKLMMAFVEEARAVTREAEKKWKHPLKLVVRVPSTPWISRRYGLDAVEWAKAGLVDMIIISPFWGSMNSDMPVETWKGMLIGTGVPVAVGLESMIDPGGAMRMSCPEETVGTLLSGLQRGADAVYFFNLFTDPYAVWPRDDYNRVVKSASYYSTLRTEPRRHAITITRPWSLGELAPEKVHTSYGSASSVAQSTASALPFSGYNGAFRIHTGPKPLPGQTAHVELVVEDHDHPLDVRVNSAPCKFMGLAEPEHLKAAGLEDQPRRQVYEIPAGALDDGYNLIETGARQEVKINWVEISIA